jgi:GTP-binding protein
MFVDEVTIEVQSGKGGDGCVSFRRERHTPRGGPDGGDGGNGGSVVIVAKKGIDSLGTIGSQKTWKAKNGSPGSGSNRHGASAEDTLLRVPPGTVVIDAENGNVLKDLDKDGEQVIAAQGGKGGKGNTRFKSPTNQTPRKSTPGGKPEVRNIRLELRVIADVGLVGKPNAGKSTLLSRLSRARPEIADYPFTTKEPMLGEVQIDRDRAFVMADIPGLIEGAHEGAGLGHQFLRHIQRAGIIVHLIEPDPGDNTNPLENYKSIRDELKKFDVELGARPEIVVITKADLPNATDVHNEFCDQLGHYVLCISAVTGAGLDELVAEIAKQVKGTDEEEW